MGSVRKGAVGAAGLATILVLAGCGESDGGGDRTKASSGAAEQSGGAAKAMTAAAQKTTEARSAKVAMTVKSPAGIGGDVKLSGALGWGPLAMDMTVDTDAPPTSQLPTTGRLLWVDDTLYLGAGKAEAPDLGGKSWLKMDVSDALDKAGAGSLAGGLDAVNSQDPGQLMTLLRAAPNVRHVGEQRIDGVTAQQYKGKLTLDEAVNADDSLDFLSESERAELLAQLRKSDVRSYAIEAWVKDDLPVRIHTTMDSPVGKVSIVQKLSDYGTDVKVRAPSVDETVDFAALMKRLAGGRS